MNWLKAITCLALAVCANAWASGEHDFCVDRASPAKSESIHVRFKYGDIDPGREAARLIVSQRYRQADTNSVTVTEYNANTCSAPKNVVEEITVSATPEQIGNLVNAVGRGDVAGAAVIAVDIAAGASVEIVKGGGSILEGVKNTICRLIGC